MKFVILRVNGQDVRSASHEATVQAVNRAKEPIVLEVMRHVRSADPLPHMVSTATQTNCVDYYHDPFVPLSLPPVLSPQEPWLQPTPTAGLQFMPIEDDGLPDIETGSGEEYGDSFEMDKAYNMEYEEVTLHRSSREEKVGLTLCYSPADEGITDIYISKIEPNSIAANDCRIREGDQILQINGIDVQTREAAIELFAAHCSDITLLLSRPQGLQTGEEEEGGTTDTATTENSTKHEKDSGVGRTDDSTRNDESSEQDLPETECASAGSCDLRFPCGSNLVSRDLHHSNDSFASNETHDHDCTGNDIAVEDCERFRQVLRTRCMNAAVSNANNNGTSSSIEHEIAMLNREMENIRFECEQIIDYHRNQEQEKCQPQDVGANKAQTARTVPKMGTRLDYSKQQRVLPVAFHVPCQDESNSVDCPLASTQSDKLLPSCTKAVEGGYTLPTLQLQISADEHDKSAVLYLPTTLPEVTTPGDDGTYNTASQHSDVNHEKWNLIQSEQLGPCKDQVDSLPALYSEYVDVMYTNQAHLEHTMMLQQELFQQQMHQGSSGKPTAGKTSCVRTDLQPPDLPGIRMGSPPKTSSVPMEWVVKRRLDGSRYITRRPVRNKLLKERAKKLTEERRGMTTDDDAMSELKVGRYWSKGDRKKHLEKARDQRRRRAEMAKNKFETPEYADKEMNIVEMSHRKMMRHKDRKALDNFTTIQEMLAHGSRDPQGKTYNPLLSVTTV